MVVLLRWDRGLRPGALVSGTGPGHPPGCRFAGPGHPARGR